MLLPVGEGYLTIAVPSYGDTEQRVVVSTFIAQLSLGRDGRHPRAILNSFAPVPVQYSRRVVSASGAGGQGHRASFYANRTRVAFRSKIVSRQNG
jgi:hypothetical protein